VRPELSARQPSSRAGRRPQANGAAAGTPADAGRAARRPPTDTPPATAARLCPLERLVAALGDPAWAAHITSSAAAARPQVHAGYARALPDAQRTDLHASLGVSWQAPDRPSPLAPRPSTSPARGDDRVGERGPGRWRPALLLVVAVLLGIFVWTLCLAWAARDADGMCATIGCWVCIGIPAAQGLTDCAHGHHRHRTDRW